MCIYKKAYSSEDTRQKFWDYIKTVHRECDNKLNEDCSIYAHKEIHFSWEETMTCVENSFSSQIKEDWTKETVTNSMIDKDLDYWAKYGSALFPSVVINNSTYRGQLETQEVMNAICAGFADPPKMCKRILNDADIENDLAVGVIYFNDGYKMKHVVGICAFFTFSLLLFLCCYRRHAKREMKHVMDTQIESAVNHYISL
jgi:hypothetical protein